MCQPWQRHVNIYGSEVIQGSASAATIEPQRLSRSRSNDCKNNIKKKQNLLKRIARSKKKLLHWKRKSRYKSTRYPRIYKINLKLEQTKWSGWPATRSNQHQQQDNTTDSLEAEVPLQTKDPIESVYFFSQQRLADEI